LRQVYFIQGKTTGNIKIGVANDPEARLRDLQIGSSEDLTLLGCLVGSEDLEAALHSQFNEYHIRGEWFRPGRRLTSFLSGRVAPVYSVSEQLTWKGVQGGSPWQSAFKTYPAPLCEFD
jgi:hypothetical protein